MAQAKALLVHRLTDGSQLYFNSMELAVAFIKMLLPLAEQKPAKPRLVDLKLAYQKPLDKKLVDQKIADQKLADNKLPDSALAGQELADQKLADQNLADQKLADMRADLELADKLADQKPADKNIADQKEPDSTLVDKKLEDQKQDAEESFVSKFNQWSKMDGICSFCGATDVDPFHNQSDKRSQMKCYNCKRTWDARNLNAFGLTLVDCIKRDRETCVMK